jgi:Mor family transcriptional regulator
LPQSPVTDGILSKTERSNQLRKAYQNGGSVIGLSDQFEISPQRIYQILRDN